MLVTALALAFANLPAAQFFSDLLHSDVLGLSILHWVNDGLMAVFFLLMGLDIKRELLVGQLATWQRRALPGIAAVGGMIMPAAIFVAINWGQGVNLRGWAIPSATDIAFALAVISLLGRRVPIGLKVFLTAVAILDDLGAVLIIALFYTSELSLWNLGMAVSTFTALVALNRTGVKYLAPYLILGAVLWSFVLNSGVHATVAGIAVALTIPMGISSSDSPSTPLFRLHHALGPWVAYLVVPMFGFANAGVSFSELSLSSVLNPVPLGSALGLFLGKQVGIFTFAWLAIKAGVAELPRHASWLHLYGVAVLCGIGFTMSLFIGFLAYPESETLQTETKVGVLLGSLFSGAVGWAVVRFASAKMPSKALHS